MSCPGTRVLGLALVLVLSGTAAGAQITASSVAVTPVSVAKGAETSSLPAGTVLVAPGATTGTTISVSSTNALCPVVVETRASIDLDATGVALTVDNKSSVQGFFCPSEVASCGSHSVLMTFAAASATNTTLTIDTSAPMAGVTSYAIDLHDDGSVELSSGMSAAAGHLQLPVSLAPGQPLVIRIDTALSSALVPGRSHFMNVRAHLAEGTPLPAYGTSCGFPYVLPGPEFSASVTPRVTEDEYRFYGLGQSGPEYVHFFVFGVTQLSVPIAQPGCTLLTSIELALPVYPDARWRTYLTVPVPQGLGPAPLYAQYLVAQVGSSGVIWQTSVGVDWSLQ